MSNDKKNLLITGAGTGIGAEIAKFFSRNGYRSILIGRTESKLKETQKSILGEGGEAEFFVADVADEKAANVFFSDYEKSGRKLDVLVNNAGVIQPIGRLTETDPQEWEKCLRINLFGAYLWAKSSISLMLKNGGGRIVNISSGAASGPMEGWSAYCASKAGLRMLTRSIHLEYGNEKIRSFGLRPGVVDTPMQGLIRESGINAVSQLKRSDLSSAFIPAKATFWLAETEDTEFLGGEVDVRDPHFIEKAGLSR